MKKVKSLFQKYSIKNIRIKKGGWIMLELLIAIGIICWIWKMVKNK